MLSPLVFVFKSFQNMEHRPFTATSTTYAILQLCFLSLVPVGLTVMIHVFLFFNYFHSVFGSSSQCQVTDVKSLLEGCDRLTGMNVTSVGGTIVNDHNCDVLLPKQVFAEEPLFQYELADSVINLQKKFYTILMVDPDAAPQIEGEFFMHLLKSNIPGLALKARESSKTVGIDYRGYKSPSPSRGTGPHRYMILLYEQGDGNNFLPTVPPRSRFTLANWLRGKNLCGPVAATQFRLQF